MLLLIVLIILPLLVGTIRAFGEIGYHRERLALVGENREKREVLRLEQQQLDSLYLSLNLHVTREQQFSDILDKINRFAKEAMVGVISLQPKEREKHGWYEKQPVELYLEGTFHGIGKFVNNVEKMKHIIGVERLAVGAVNMLSTKVKASVMINVYMGK